ncbi:fatty acid hydroxylase domain-containing protein 2 [Teleopsis dalmanni]|uniref:fatty acid hydroxylase domain-containing protein 2 n=1 Tax=Teleopsis dalmanni TaxID=139649 RepID=UPI0018CDD100|nr:fatty acid hydroxylase domain-containing protein 2 [Teleopsis dalmanni]
MESKQLKQISIGWRNLGESLEIGWNKLLDATSDDPMLLWVFGSTIVVFTTYWLYAAFFTIMDITNRPTFLRKYKIQPGQNEPVDQKRLINAIKVVLINQTVISTPIFYLLYKSVQSYQHLIPVRELPTFKKFVFDMAVITILEEFMFYYAHRLLHHKSIYKYVHKKHHEWTAPIAAITFYCNPIEHIASNLLPVVVAIGLLKSHISTAWLFTALAIINAMSDHTGYSFPFSAKSVRFHDLHHEKFNYNYGVFGWLDKLHGTYRESCPSKLGAKFKKHKQ